MKKIFVLEGEWEPNAEDKTSVLEIFRFLKNLKGIDFFYRRAATKEEFLYYLNRPKDFEEYELVFFAFHGQEGTIYPGEDSEITLEDLYQHKSFFKGKILHMSSCKTLNFRKQKLENIKSNLGVKYLSGYKKDIDWLDSMLFETAYLYLWQDYKKRGKDLQKNLDANYGFLGRRLGFVMV